VLGGIDARTKHRNNAPAAHAWRSTVLGKSSEHRCVARPTHRQLTRQEVDPTAEEQVPNWPAGLPKGRE